MNTERYQITAIGKKHPDLMSDISSDLFDHGCDIHTIASMGLGDSMVMMLIIDSIFNEESIRKALQHVALTYKLELNISDCSETIDSYEKSNAFFVIKGTTSNSTLKEIIKILTHAGLNIHAMESGTFKVKDESDNEDFICNIKGYVADGIESLSEAVKLIEDMNLNIRVAADRRLAS